MLTEAERDIAAAATDSGATLIGRRQPAARHGDDQPHDLRRCFGDRQRASSSIPPAARCWAWRHLARNARPRDPQRQRTRRLRAQWRQGEVALDRDRQWRSRPRHQPDRPRRHRLFPNRARAGRCVGRPYSAPPTGPCSSCRPAMPRRRCRAGARGRSTSTPAAQPSPEPARTASAALRGNAAVNFDLPISRRNRDFARLAI